MKPQASSSGSSPDAIPPPPTDDPALADQAAEMAKLQQQLKSTEEQNSNLQAELRQLRQQVRTASQMDVLRHHGSMAVAAPELVVSAVDRARFVQEVCDSSPMISSISSFIAPAL